MYNFPLEVSLRANPSDLAAFRKQVESTLSGIQFGNVDNKNFAKVNAQLNNLTGGLEKGDKAAKTFFERVEGKGRSFAAYTVASSAILKLTNSVSQATREAIKFEKELLKISQVTGDTVGYTKNLSASLVKISKNYDVTLSKVAQLTRTLTQTGLSFREAAKGAEILARTSLLATFDSLTSTTEGLIAVMQTFEVSVGRAGKVLEAINAVSKQFAVESGDIVEAIRRTGGAFSTANGQIEELIALFTAVRSTSRESAETIATGFRTIFGRLQRPKTIEYFKELGIVLEDAKGQFVGPYQAIENISNGLKRLGIVAGTTRFAEVVEQIGGIRQISRVVPLLEQFEKAQRALGAANNSGAESIQDVEKAQKGLGFQLGRLQKEFGALINDIIGSSSFKFFAETFINIARSVIKLTSALKPLLPLLATVATFKIGRGLTKLLSGGFSAKGIKEAAGFASGGMVPGSGNGDTVPAMLTPGEFVIRKSAVKAFGADRLAKINKYAQGGPVTLNELTKRQGKSTITSSFNEERQGEDSVYADLDRKQRKFDPKDSIWEKVVQETDRIYKDRGGKGKPFSAQGKAFENIIKEAIGNTGNLPDDYPIDIIDSGNPIEVKFTKKLTSDKDLVSKLYRHKFLQNQLPNLSGWTPEPTDKVDLGKLTIEEMGEGEKEKFNSWYGSRVSQGLNQGGEAKKAKDFGQIFLSGGSDRIEARYNPNDTRTGSVNAKKWKDGIWTVGLSMASKGYGPKLYDVVMEAVTELGGMLTSDRATVSGAAKSVWDYYFKNRGDVKKIPLPRDAWTGNYEMIDEKLRGPEDTWPPKDDPAWTLQSGYKKSPSLINDTKLVKRIKGGQSSAKTALDYFAARSLFADGGSVGTDTVPALLTPGEFVINKKSAQSFGYNNLRKINKYAKGGIVDGVQYFEDGDVVEKIREKRGPINEKALADMVKVIQKMADDAGTTFEKMSDELIDKFENGENALLELDDAVKNATGRSLELGGKNVKDLGPEAFKEASEIMKDVLQEVRSKSVAEEASKPVADVAAEDVPTPKKGKTGKAKRGISEERRKQLKEEALAKQNAEAGGSGLTRAGRREASETASAKTEIDTIAIQEKWDSYIKEEVKNAKSFYQERMNNVSDPVKLLMEGASVEEIGKAIQEQNKIQADYKQAVADIKEQAEQLKGMDIEKAAASNQAESEAEVRTKEAEVSAKSAEEAKPVSTKPVEDATKSLADKIKQGGGKVYDSLSSLGISYAEAALQAQAIASGLANFGGFKVNQEALAQGQVKGGMLSGASEVVGKAADPKAIKGFGSQLNKVGKMLPKQLGGPVRKMGGALLKNADKIAKGASMAAKALNVLSYVELGGGLFDSLLSEDYSAQRDNLIQLGDAAGAAEAAQKAYAQEMLRSIPIIGGFVTGLASYFNLLPTQLDGTGQLVVANARLEATINGTDKAVTKAKKAFQEAASLKDEEGQKKAIGTQLNKATELQDLSNKSADLQSGSGTSLAAGGLGAVGGAAAGAAIGSVIPIIGTALGGIAGAVIGGGMALWNSSGASKKAIIESYELQAEAAKKGAEIIQDVTKSFGSVLVEESKNMVQNGGTYEDAFKKASEAMGNENMDVIKQQLGPAGADLGKDATADIENLGDASQQLDKELLQLRSGLDQLSDKARAEREAEIARKEALQGNIDTMRDQIVAAEAARVAEEKLEKERRIAAAALKHQIKLQKEMTAERRRFNKSVRSMEDDLEDMDNAGTGNMSSRQGMEAAGYNADLYRQETGEILDSSESANEIARDIGGAAGGEVIAANKRRQKIDSITSDPEAMAEILADSTDASGKRDPEKIREKINEKLKEEDPDFKPDATFENAMVDFSNTVAKEGTSAVTKAGEAAKESVSQSAQEAIDQQKQQAEQMGKMQQELRKREIELINRNYATAQKAYDAEKAYFEKRMALNNKVEDFLDPIAEGPEKAKKMMERSNKRYAEQRAGLEERRAKQFGEVGSFTQRGGGDPAFGAAYAAGGMQGAIDYAGKGLTGAASSEDPGTDLAKFQNQIDMLSNTIADEIGIEEERLDSLIESAKAQQEYTQALNDAQGSLVRDLVTGTEEDVANQLNTMNAAAMAAQQGSFAGIPEDMKKDIFGLFDKFDDIEIPGFGKTGRDLKREITKNELMMNFGYDEATADKLASKSVNDKVPVDEKMAEQIKAQQENLQRLYEQEKQLNDYKIQAERESNQKFSDAVDRFAAKVDAEKANLEDRRQNKPPEEPEEYKEPEKEEEQKDPVADAQTALDEAEAQVQQEKDKIAGRTAKIEELDQEAEGIKQEQAAAARTGGQSYVPDPQKAARLKEIENEKQKINSESDGGLGMLKANEARNQAQTNLRQAQADEQAKQDAEMQAKEDAFVRNSQTQNESTNSEAQASNEDRGTGGNFIDDVLDDPSYQDEDPFTPTNPPSRPTAATASSPSSMPTSIDSGVAASTGLQTSIVSDENFMAGLREAGAIAPGMAASVSTPSFSDAMASDPSFGNPNVDPFAPQGQTSGPPSAPSMPPSAQSGGSSQSSSESNSTGSEDATSGAKGGNSDQGPLQVNTQGQQDITVRLPDVQAMVSQNISGMVFDTIGGVFNKLAEDVRSANDFNDVANAFQQGVTQTSTKQMT
jgi:hypothetical protein